MLYYLKLVCKRRHTKEFKRKGAGCKQYTFKWLRKKYVYRSASNKVSGAKC